MPDLYVTAAELKAGAQESDASNTDSWELLALAVSRMFDRECEVPDSYFMPAAAAASERVFRGKGTEYVRLDPYVADSIDALSVADEVFLVGGDDYYENEGYLVFGVPTPTSSQPSSIIIENGAVVTVSARWGFAAIPGEIRQACLEQGLFMWRKRDLAFTELSGISSVAIVAKFSPTFLATVERYRALYGRNTYFA